ncbi:MAG: SDR family NAD(P)-dependent oxidoreductase [Alphaproteobacteria bacterium]|nr:SDR family NAD(P)-dependent oxidoreductase [Alphaproteobacteria bacterium]MDE2042970.1 SDR family NAD(P)-dependent oxidoreductase [Alphaproteobacteria bacterium]MDE2339960.1 SDR family NAD(P)-dependent oxidoreductase [Alphaproteobacteria bacterium]
MRDLFIFGLGYSAQALATLLRAQGWRVTGTTRDGRDGTLRFDDQVAVHTALAQASHILSSVPPERAGGDDQVLSHYGDAIRAAPARWVGYLSSAGVYGDTGGAWVDESAPIGTGRRSARAAADEAWQGLRGDVCVFRLPGIFGPGRSALERVREGRAYRVDMPGQVFNRVHVEDIVAGVIASFAGPPGVYNLADDAPCSQNLVIEYAARLLGAPLPSLIAADDPRIGEQARAFYTEQRRISTLKAKRLLGWQPLYPDYKAGLAACLPYIV